MDDDHELDRNNEDVSNPESYIQLFNKLYADDDIEQAMRALIKLIYDTDTVHIEKQEIASECPELDTSDLNINNTFEKLQAVAVIRLVTKIVGGANNEEYVLPNTSVIKTISDSNGWGLRSSDLDEYPRVEKLLKRFTNRYNSVEESPPIESDIVSSPHELYLEHHLMKKTSNQALDSLDEIDVSLEFDITSKSINSNTTKYRFELTGEVTGIATPDTNEILNYLKQEMVQLTLAAAHEATTRCPCSTIEAHLQQIEPDGNGCIITEDSHFAEFVEEDRVKFKTILSNLEHK